MGKGGGAAEREWADAASAPGDEKVRLKSVRVVNELGRTAPEVDIREPISVEVAYWNLSDEEDFQPIVSLEFSNSESTHLFTTHANHLSEISNSQGPTLIHARCRIPGNFLAEGGVFILAGVVSYQPPTVHAVERDAVAFHVLDPSEGDGVRGAYPGDFPGVVRPMLEWEEWRESPR